MRILSAIIAILLAWPVPLRAEAPEYQVKAAMLANFALFVDWPPTAFSSEAGPFIVYVLGEDPFGPWLKHEMGDRVGTHPVQIRHAGKAEEIGQCHLVFVCRSEQRRMKQELASLQKYNALIVSDAGRPGDFCRGGGMVALVMEGSKVRFELNAEAAEKAGLRFSSKLKRIARTAQCGEER